MDPWKQGNMGIMRVEMTIVRSYNAKLIRGRAVLNYKMQVLVL